MIWLLYEQNMQVVLYFSALRHLSELSTPFLNLKAFLDIVLNPTGGIAASSSLLASRLSLINSIVFFITFFLCRMIPMPNIWTVIVNAWYTKWAPNLELYFKLIFLAFSALLDGLNIVWFWKIIRKVMKMFRPKKA
jgi:hypothetical protein